MRGTIKATVCSLLIAGCALTEAPTPVAVVPSAVLKTSPFALSAQDKSAIEAAVRESLKDPLSAQFGASYAVETPDKTIYVCGYVNAKNSFGGYTGKKLYYGILAVIGAKSVFGVIGIGGTDIETAAVTEQCRSHGVPI